jgi:hypothetical protein
MHKELLRKAVEKGIYTQPEANKIGKGLDRLKASGAIGLYHFKEEQLAKKIKKTR